MYVFVAPAPQILLFSLLCIKLGDSCSLAGLKQANKPTPNNPICFTWSLIYIVPAFFVFFSVAHSESLPKANAGDVSEVRAHK